MRRHLLQTNILRTMPLLGTVLALVVMCAGCSKEPRGTDPDAMAELSFVTSVSTQAKPWNTQPASQNLPTEQPGTRAAAEPIAEGTQLRIMVFAQHDNPATATPVAQGCYLVTGSAGATTPATIDDRIILHGGTYDFYIITPQTAPIAGKITATNGTETLTSGKQTLEVMPDASGKCNLSVQLVRQHSMLDATIYYETHGGISSVAIAAGDELSVTGLFSTAELALDGSAFTASGSDGTVSYAAARFATATDPAGSGTAGISTATNGIHRGVPVLPGTATLQVSAPIVFNGDVTRTCTATIPGALMEPGKYYTLKLKVSLNGQIAATMAEWTPSPGNGPEEMGLIDLSENGTANCYIVSKAGANYRFDATKKGNGKATLKIGDPDVWADQRANIDPNDDLIAPKTLAPASAFVLWSTGSDINGLLEKVTLKEGYVYFSTVAATPFAQGNAVIGVKDAGGNLIWSWHIWATTYNPATEDRQYVTRTLSDDGLTTPGHIVATPSRTFTMMSRNLGAINNTPNDIGALGVLYQWGRKDPFIGSAAYLNEKETTAFDDKTAATKTASGYPWTTVPTSSSGSDAAASIAYAIQHPTSFICYSDNTVTYDWLNVNTIAQQRDYLWGNPNPTATIPSPVAGSKSIYDPCPPGYRVPQQESWTRFTTSGTSSIAPEDFNIQKNSSPNWIFFYASDGNGLTDFYPSPGSRYASSGLLDRTSVMGCYWSASPYYGGNHLASCLFFGQYTNTPGSVSIYPQYNLFRTNGYSIRCAKE